MNQKKFDYSWEKTFGSKITNKINLIYLPWKTKCDEW